MTDLLYYTTGFLAGYVATAHFEFGPVTVAITVGLLILLDGASHIVEVWL